MELTTENEIGFIINDSEVFDKICSWNGEEFGGWILPFDVQRSSIFLDTEDFTLNTNDKVLSLVTNASLKEPDMNKFMFKVGKYKDNFRKESSIFFQKNEDYTTYLNKICSLAGEEKLESKLVPKIVMKQHRFKRYFIEDSTKIFISIDSATFFKPDDTNNPIGTVYVCEIETAEESVSPLVQNKIKELANIIKVNYEGVPSNKSKYEYGLQFLFKQGVTL
ncbi:hypothetical protein ACIQF3_26665 [Bacillus thuringiensis]|uniref:hypothetical protein n=1 Tax=Bacillus thuringiensis TaxID=1428 RepID=UPI002FFFBF5E